MNIRFISTLTAEDEGQFAPAILRAVSALIDTMPIAYTLRIETLDGEVFQHTNPPPSSGVAVPEHRGAPVAAVARMADA